MTNTATTATYIIEPVRFVRANGTTASDAETAGYKFADYLPGYHEPFAARAEAETYIAENHRGPDCVGISAEFAVAGG